MTIQFITFKSGLIQENTTKIKNDNDCIRAIKKMDKYKSNMRIDKDRFNDKDYVKIKSKQQQKIKSSIYTLKQDKNRKPLARIEKKKLTKLFAELYEKKEIEEVEKVKMSGEQD